MKSKTIVALFGLAFAASASAQTEVHLTGSTAFRSSIHSAILAKMGGTVSYAYTGSSLGSAAQAIFTGTIDGNSVIVKTSWSGSADGINTVANGIGVPFLPTSTTKSPSGTANAPTTGLQSLTPDAAFSDVYQGSTVYTSPTLQDKIVAIAPFKWVASKSAPATLTNITPQQVQALFGAGTMPLSLFTGDSADQGKTVYAMGRNPDSGTRITAFAEAGLGPFYSTVQFIPTISNGFVTEYLPSPEDLAHGWIAGNTGYSSGGTLATAMGADSSSLNAISITYLGLTDAAAAITAGAKELSYNGVTYTADNTRQGKYTFWCYEHLFYQNSLGGVVKDTVDSLGTQLNNVPGAAGISSNQTIPSTPGSFDVGRPTDGATVVPTF